MTAPSEFGTDRTAVLGFACAVAAVIAALLVFWLWLPSIALGAIAVVLGLLARRRGVAPSSARDLAVAAIALGIVAILVTPAVNLIAKGEEDYGRKCALNPQHPDC